MDSCGRLSACRAAPNRALSIGSAEDSAARAKASTAIFGWPALRSASPISRQPSTKFGKRRSRSSRADPAFSSLDSMSVRQARKAASARSGAKRTARSNHIRACARLPAARHARRDDQRRYMIGAQAQARVGPARGVFKSTASERDCRRQLMRRRILRSRIQDPIAHNCRAFGPPGAEFRQSALKQRLSISSRLCHRIPSPAPMFERSLSTASTN